MDDPLQVDGHAGAGDEGGLLSVKLHLLQLLVDAEGESFTARELQGVLHLPLETVQVALNELGQEPELRLTGEPVEFSIPVELQVQARKRYASWTGQSSCRKCGCVDDWGCPEGCWWVAPDLCSCCTEGETC